MIMNNNYFAVHYLTFIASIITAWTQVQKHLRRIFSQIQIFQTLITYRK